MPSSTGGLVVRDADAEARHREARAALEAMEARLREQHRLPVAERIRQQQAMGPDLQRLVSICKETQLQNRAHYLLAHWTFAFQDDPGLAQSALAALYASPYPGQKLLAKVLEVQVLIRQGRLVKAREEAERLRAEGLDGDAPDQPVTDPFGSMVTLVGRAEMAQSAAQTSALSGLAIDWTNGLTEPWEAKPGTVPWRVVVVCSTLDEDRVWQAEQFVRQAVAVPGSCEVVILALDASPQMAMRSLAHWNPSWPVRVLFARNVEEARRWETDWGLMVDPMVQLVDQQGRLRRVLVRPADLAPLLASRSDP